MNIPLRSPEIISRHQGSEQATVRAAPFGAWLAGRLRALPRTVALCVACVIGMVVLFLALQALALALTKDRAIAWTLKHAAQQSVLTPDNFPMSPYGHEALDNDIFTDCIAMSVNLGNEHQPLLQRLAASPFFEPVSPDHYDGLKPSPCGVLIQNVSDLTLNPTLPYYRYWHGHQIYLRPLLSIMDLGQVRILNALLLIGALSVLAVQLARRFGPWAAPALIVPLATGTQLLSAPVSTVHALSWITAFMTVVAVIHALERNVSLRAFAVLMAVLGSIGVFFDLLFSPPLAPTFAAFLILAYGLQRGPARDAIYDAILLTAAWFGGFVLAWVGKWAFAATAFGLPVVIDNVLYSMRQRSFSDETLAAPRHLFEATATAMTDMDLQTITVACIVAGAGVAYYALTRHRAARAIRPIAIMLSVLIIPVVWVELLRDHSIVHPGFASRAFVLFAVLPLLALLELRQRLQIKYK